MTFRIELYLHLLYQERTYLVNFVIVHLKSYKKAISKRFSYLTAFYYFFSNIDIEYTVNFLLSISASIYDDTILNNQSLKTTLRLECFLIKYYPNNF